MGKVYLAQHPTLGNLVAIKELAPFLAQDAKFRQRFLQEAQAQARLSHPYIVEVKDLIEDESGVFLIMEYMPGGSLEDIIERSSGPLDPGWVLPRVRQALSALDFAHQKGVIHRDVKPSNILLDPSDNAKVSDFGIAIVLGSRRLTATGTALGSPHYMSPEQITRPKEVDHRADVYSMGIVLYEMLTGRVPFEGDTDFNIKLAHVNEPPPLPRQLNQSIPEALEQAVLKALAKDPVQRFGGCGEFARALELAISDAAVAAPIPTAQMETPSSSEVRREPATPPPLTHAEPPLEGAKSSRRRRGVSSFLPPPGDTPAVSDPMSRPHVGATPGAQGAASTVRRTTPPSSPAGAKDGRAFAISGSQRRGFVKRYCLMSAVAIPAAFGCAFGGLYLLFGWDAGFLLKWLAVLACFLSGALMGLGQWQVLRRAMTLTTGWILASGGTTFVLMTSFYAFLSLGWIDEEGVVLFSLTAAGMFITIPALVLLRHAKGTWWWYVTSLFGWALAFAVAAALVEFADRMTGTMTGESIGFILALGVAGLVVALFQALALLRLRRKERAAAKPKPGTLGWQIAAIIVILTIVAWLLP